MKKLAALILVALLGCSGMPDAKVDGVDNLITTEHVMNPIEVALHCTEAMGIPVLLVWLATPLACATIVLDTWTCDIYYSEMFAGLTLEHERSHCEGKWHDGALKEYYDRWIAAGGRRS